MPSQRTLTIAAIAVALIALAAWAFVTSGRRKEEFATRALLEARLTAERGNLPLAATQFQGVIDTYRGSDAAQEAMIGINQLRLINGQSDLAAVSLREFIASNPEPRFAAPAHGLLGAALENAGLPAEAAAAYQNAANIAAIDYLKAEYLVQAGRALVAAGNQADAEAAYGRVVSEFGETASATEAQVRLSELTAGRAPATAAAPTGR
ncbi:MAG TPA: tetratricopeptide repeat protein [Gemmatimonadales bacterium]